MEDWLSTLAGQPHEEEVDDDGEDFYGYNTNNNGDAKPGAMEIVRSEHRCITATMILTVVTMGRTTVLYLSMGMAKAQQSK